MTAELSLHGIIPPLATPLTPDGEVDVRSLERLAARIVDAGAAGLFVLGSTGEVAFLTDEQRVRVTETVVSVADGRVPVLAGAIDMTTPRVRRQVAAAAAAGADAAVVTAPFYTRTHPAEIARHFRLVAESSPVPQVAYDIPVAVGTKLDTSTVLDLAADGTIVALKDSSGDDAGLRRVILGARERGLDRFAVLTGSELTVDSALAFGAAGCVPGLGNVDPHAYVRLYTAARAGDWAAARSEQDRLFALFGLVDAAPAERMGRGSSALGAFKAALHLLGVIDDARTADPYIPLDDAEVAVVRRHLEQAGLLR
ncbi:dihydrodipicolinate synthase family protein [Microbacterium marinilacus]|uniref:Dihydrodipicolinate synthase family protein n=1 Tax=Microbacterium marinilacus TaxID=415209 RepID=A0ABP7BYF7_9MICO|nr:dihydrodipicolinate synthase family protein [Microbacterium marinilacus]MBY0688057.1 dihydrodipicolinate synthase family protein [Microbacterium marinilacus]